MAKKVWITYAWADNQTGDVDFVAQRLSEAGIEVRMDKWDLVVGQRLWDQIDRFISDANECDAWVWYVTQNSLGSGPCREEFAYALDRALAKRTANFPVIGLLQSSSEHALLPASLRTRLYVNIQQDDWVSQVLAGVNGIAPGARGEAVKPYEVTVHQPTGKPYSFVVEMRPRGGYWGPCFVGVKVAEREETRYLLSLYAILGPKGHPPELTPDIGPELNAQNFAELGEPFCTCVYDEECTPTRSLFAYFSKLPSVLAFGVPKSSGPVYTARFGTNTSTPQS